MARVVEAATKSVVDYVDPNIGGIGRLLTATMPTVQLPHGMAAVAPITPRGIMDRYLANAIVGFPVGGVSVMATTGALELDAAQGASGMDHDLETATPYYYAVTLERYDVEAEYTVSCRAIYFRFTFPQGQAGHLLWRGREAGSIAVTGPAALEGGQEGARGGRIYFAAEFSEPFTVAATGAQPVTALAFAGGKTVGVRVGISYQSIEQARKNLAAEIPGWDFEAAKTAARAVWEKALGQVAITGGTEAQRTIFYTSLYRALLRMVEMTEDGKYVGFDGQVHEAGAHPYHSNDWIWDTYRCMHPLQLLLDPRRQEHMIQSYVRMYEQSGWLPRFPGIGMDYSAMIGHHTAALVADTYFKGHRDFDVEKAYEGIKKNLLEASKRPFKGGEAGVLERHYAEHGYYPALAKGEEETVAEVHPHEKRQAVAVTLEASYDDWCLGRLAKALGKSEDHAYFMQRAGNYRNVFDSRCGFMAPRSADGKWVEDFDPKYGGGQGARAWFAECNSWTYTWHVQHDVAGLMALLGGREKFLAKLDALFVEQYDPKNKYRFLEQFPDATALIGQFCQGNEPSFHIPYLYCYAGQPWKTQRLLREIMKVWFNDGPEGVPGDEDGGAMSSWYVLSAAGFYPVCPGEPYYVIGSPLFAETKITRADGQTFTVVAKDVSAKNKYIQAATLNGKPLNKPWFAHAEIKAGGSLVLEMGPRPNKAWGSAKEAAPPSMSEE